MTTPLAKIAYRRRKELSEPTFGIMKEQLGLRRFLLRGLENIKAETLMVATAFNLRFLYRVWHRQWNKPWKAGVVGFFSFSSGLFLTLITYSNAKLSENRFITYQYNFFLRQALMVGDFSKVA